MTSSTVESTVVQQRFIPDLAPGQNDLFHPTNQGILQDGTDKILTDLDGNPVFDLELKFLGAKVDHFTNSVGPRTTFLVEYDLDGYKFTISSGITTHSARSHAVSIACIFEKGLELAPIHFRLIPGQRPSVQFINFLNPNGLPYKNGALDTALRRAPERGILETINHFDCNIDGNCTFVPSLAAAN